MKKIQTIFVLACVSLLVLTACDDYLDVKPKDEVYEEDMFSSFKGFKDALNGCYIQLASRSLYGENLTMTYTENLACLWSLQNGYSRPADYELKNRQYDGADAKSALKTVYGKLFNTIVEANMIIKNCEQNGSKISDKAVLGTIEGEAYAIRAWCQFDILRLFGQVPQNATIEVSLPYSETTSIHDMPSYYTFDQYVARLKQDIDKALSLLKDNDPIFTYTFDQLNEPSGLGLNENWLAYRQFHFNYWGVKGLLARLYNYVGDRANAHAAALELIHAKDVNGNALMPLSGSKDIANEFFALPSECLLALNKYDLKEYSPSVVGGIATLAVELNKTMCINNDWQFTNMLFSGVNTASDNRYNKVWERNTMAPNNYGQKSPTIKKYYSTSTASNAAMTKMQVIPLLRMSEIYLIAMENSDDLDEVNSLYKEYERSHDVLITEDKFASLDAVKTEMMNEYRREFVGEGVMFYVYKRRNHYAAMMFSGTVEKEESYVLPLPDSEFDPAALKD